MIILYNADIYNNLKEKVSNGIFKVSNPIFNFLAPSTWTKVKRNMRMIDKALSHHDEPKDRAKELKEPLKISRARASVGPSLQEKNYC